MKQQLLKSLHQPCNWGESHCQSIHDS